MWCRGRKVATKSISSKKKKKYMERKKRVCPQASNLLRPTAIEYPSLSQRRATQHSPFKEGLAVHSQGVGSADGPQAPSESVLEAELPCSRSHPFQSNLHCWATKARLWRVAVSSRCGDSDGQSSLHTFPLGWPRLYQAGTAARLFLAFQRG